MAGYLSVVLEGFCFTYTKLLNAPKPGHGVFFCIFKALFFILIDIVLRQVKGHRQVYLYFACIEIKVFGPLSLVLMANLKRHISSHKKPLQIVLEKSKDISNYSVFVIKA